MNTDTQLRHQMASSYNLRIRAESVVKHKLATATITPTEREMLNMQPSGHLLWAIASNPTVLTNAKTYLEDELNVDKTLDDALDATVPDGDLEYIILQELTCLQ